MLPSPCVGICRIDERFGLCRGCARSRSEVASWAHAPREVIDQVWAELPARRAQMDLRMHRLRWDLDDVRAFTLNTLRFGGGTWVAGVYGAVAEFCLGQGERIALDVGHRVIKASSPRGSMLLRLAEHIRALAFGSLQNHAEANVIILVVPRERANLVPCYGLTNLGPDVGAVRRMVPLEQLYDLGLGRLSAGFGIRTADLALAATLDRLEGLQWLDLLTLIGPELVQQSPTRIVRHSLGRIEIFTKIPPPNGQSPAGPHTHFLPSQLALGTDLPPSLELPEVYVPCTIHYPENVASDKCADH